MAKKFILQGKSIRISASVDYHLELVQKPGIRPNNFNFGRQPEQKPDPVKGGGWWHADDKEKFILFYSASTDFGPVTLPDLISACSENYFSARWDGYQVYYSECLQLEKALQNKILIHQIPQ
jgi:hypothetical protein